MARQILLTDWHEAWLDSSADILKMKPVLGRLRDAQVSVVLFSAGDRAQLEPIREALALFDPFIVESGSAIFTPVEHSPFEQPLGDRDGDYFVEQLGCPYVQARAGLRVVANMISHPLKGFGDFTIPQLQRLAGLSEEAAHRAKAREFSELFMTPKAIEPSVLKQAAEEMGFGVIWRRAEESRFSELIGTGAGLTAAVAAVLSSYLSSAESSAEKIEVVGLSYRQSAIDCLLAAKGAVEDKTSFKSVLLSSTSADDWIAAVESTGFLSLS